LPVDPRGAGERRLCGSTGRRRPARPGHPRYQRSVGAGWRRGSDGRRRRVARRQSGVTPGIRGGGAGRGPGSQLGRGRRSADRALPQCPSRAGRDSPRSASCRMKIVGVANFVMALSGGLRTALGCLGAGYLAAGHDPILVVPGERFADEQTEMGRVIKLPGPELPGTGGYRVLVDRRRVAAQLDRLGPDRLEVSDRTTLRWTGRWARHAGVPSIMVSHESLAGLVQLAGVPGADLPMHSTPARLVRTTPWSARPAGRRRNSAGSGRRT
jgi:hypothetical protein